MSTTDAQQAMQELTMVLMYLSRFTETGRFASPEDVSAWKGYSFDILDQLTAQDYIWQGNHPSRTKRVCLTEDGVAYAKELLDKYNISDWKE